MFNLIARISIIIMGVLKVTEMIQQLNVDGFEIAEHCHAQKSGDVIVYNIFKTKDNNYIKVYDIEYLKYCRHYHRDGARTLQQLKDMYTSNTGGDANNLTGELGIYEQYAADLFSDEYIELQHKHLLEEYICSKKINEIEYICNVLLSTEDYIVIDYPHPDKYTSIDQIDLFEPTVSTKVKSVLNIPHDRNFTTLTNFLKLCYSLWSDTKYSNLESNKLFNTKIVGLNEIYTGGDNPHINLINKKYPQYNCVINGVIINDEICYNIRGEVNGDHRVTKVDIPGWRQDVGLTIVNPDVAPHTTTLGLHINKITGELLYSGIEHIRLESLTRCYYIEGLEDQLVSQMIKTYTNNPSRFYIGDPASNELLTVTV